MIKAAIVGFGNTGLSAYEAIGAAADFELAGVVIRNKASKTLPDVLKNIPVVEDIRELGQVDVAILCTPSRSMPDVAKPLLEMGIHTVDSYDMHDTIWDVKQMLDKSAKKGGAVSILSAGFDPGLDSVIRVMFEAVAPRGITYTNFGPGMSMGHTVAVKAIEGVRDALSITMPQGAGIHSRMVYIALESGYNFEEVAQKIKADPYFVKDDTRVMLAEDIESLIDVGHGANIVRKGASGVTSNQLFEFNMKINNPALTSQGLVSAARAAVKQAPGCYTIVEIPPVDMLYGNRESLIRRLV